MTGGSAPPAAAVFESVEARRASSAKDSPASARARRDSAASGARGHDLPQVEDEARAPRGLGREHRIDRDPLANLDPLELGDEPLALEPRERAAEGLVVIAACLGLEDEQPGIDHRRDSRPPIGQGIAGRSGRRQPVGAREDLGGGDRARPDASNHRPLVHVLRG